MNRLTHKVFLLTGLVLMMTGLAGLPVRSMEPLPEPTAAQRAELDQYFATWRQTITYTLPKKVKDLQAEIAKLEETKTHLRETRQKQQKEFLTRAIAELKTNLQTETNPQKHKQYQTELKHFEAQLASYNPSSVKVSPEEIKVFNELIATQKAEIVRINTLKTKANQCFTYTRYAKRFCCLNEVEQEARPQKPKPECANYTKRR